VLEVAFLAVIVGAALALAWACALGVYRLFPGRG
jgi:hypothetical protein